MEKLIIIFLILIIFISCEPKKDKPVLEGSWKGELRLGDSVIPLVFNISRNDQDELTGTMDSPDQKVFGIPLDQITVENKSIKLNLSSINASFSGSFNSEGQLDGTWEQNGKSLPMILNKLDGPIDYSKPQDPKEPYPYNSIDISFENTDAGITLAGTLTYPEGNGPFPALVLVTGSGPQDRDEKILGHRPFLVLSDYLTRLGIAVLRFDDRGIGESEGDFTTATTMDFTLDAQAAVEYLVSQEYTAVGNMGILGHSEGGYIAPMVADMNEEIDFIILMAGPGIIGSEVILTQTKAIMQAQGVSEEVIEQAININKNVYSIINKEEDLELVSDQIMDIFLSAGMSEDAAKSQLPGLLTPWFLYFISYNPAPVLERTTIPVLAINGTLDLQVLYRENLGAIEEALIKAGNTNFTIKEFQGLNHLFQKAETGLMEEYGKIEVTIEPEVLEYIGDWIQNIN